MPAPLPAEVRIVPHRPRQLRGRAVLTVLGILALVAVVLSVPGLGPSMPAPAAQHHAAARPKPPPPIRISVGKAVYSCTVAPPPKHRKH
jgi:hypothetical protein